MSKGKILTLIVLLLVLIAIFTLYPILLAREYPDLTNRGTFGDSFGALNAMISGLAFAGIIYTIILQQNQLKMQSEELGLQRNELELTRRELNRSASAQEKSEQALAKQAENMELTSKISLYTAMLNSCADLISKDSGINYEEKQRIRNKMKSLSAKLEEIGDEMIK
ncbi:MAG: hypothetical protein HWE21_10830 [Cytophagia bacterium]|nr:hypothetical protein [Cytophagia bacterium]NVK84807.1 hypothetical protein [Cytophagia bacterium]